MGSSKFVEAEKQRAEKQEYLLIKTKYTPNDGSESQVVFFSIPESRGKEFSNNKNLLLTSVDAKSIYHLSESKYNSDVDGHNAEANNNFSRHVSYMQTHTR